MRLIDEQYTRTPFFGVPKMTAWLRRQGHWVNEKRIRRLIRLMGLEAIYPKPRLSKSCPEHKTYPCLLKGLTVEHANHVWCSDISYIRLLQGFVYLAVVMNWFSRYVLSFKLSITLENDFCINALKRALLISKPEIFNSDQGSLTDVNYFSSLPHASLDYRTPFEAYYGVSSAPKSVFGQRF